MRTVSTASAHCCAHSTPGRNNERTRGWLESELGMAFLAWTVQHSWIVYSHVKFKSFKVLDLILTAIVFKQPRSCWVRGDQTTSTIQSVCRDHSTLSPKHRTNLQLSGSLCPSYSPLCQEFSLKTFVPYHYIGCIHLGTFLSPVKAFNAGVSWSVWCRSWDVLFPYLRLGHYVRLGGQDRSRAGEWAAWESPWVKWPDSFKLIHYHHQWAEINNSLQPS